MRHIPLPPAFAADLQEVDRVVQECTRAQGGVFETVGQPLMAIKDRRIRAALTLLTCSLGDYNLKRVLHAASAVELIHGATVVHNDLVDMAARRRNASSLHARWNDGLALMAGDYFFALAAVEMALAPDARVITYFSQAVMRICEGALAPVIAALPSETAQEQYLFMIGCKNGALFEAACKAGMASGGGSPEQIEQIGQFGYALGLAAQIYNDLHDYTGDGAHNGRPAGSDLRRGVITLPLIYAAGEDSALANAA